MTSRQRAVLRVAATSREGVSRLRLVKLLFLVAQERPEVPRVARFEFVPYLHGPFSFTLYHEVGSLVRDGHLKEQGDTLSLTSLGKSEADKAGTELWSAIDRTARAHAGQDHEALLADVYARYPWYTLNAEREERRATEPPVAASAVYTVGYEGRSLDGLLDLLLRKGIRRLVDVRSNPVARRFGFHKSTLARTCPKVGVEYVHVPEVGVPSAWRADLDSPSAYGALFDRYEAEVIPEAEAAMKRLEALLEEAPSAMMCKEADPACCHRTTLARALAARTGLPAVELGEEAARALL